MTPVPSVLTLPEHHPLAGIPEGEMSEDSSLSSSDSSCSSCTDSQTSESSQASSLANCDRMMANIERSSKKVSFSFENLNEDTGQKCVTPDFGAQKPGTPDFDAQQRVTPYFDTQPGQDGESLQEAELCHRGHCEANDKDKSDKVDVSEKSGQQ